MKPTLRELRALHRKVWGDRPYREYMQRRRRERARRWVSLALVTFGGLSVVAGIVPTAGATKPTPDHKVTLCHRTDSYTNPYVVITVDVASVLKHGHDDHNGPVFWPGIPKHQKWGDIIPPFDFGHGLSYGGKNWPAGQTTFAHGCGTPPPTTVPWTTAPPSTPTTTCPKTTTTAPYGTTSTTSSVPTTVPGSTTTSVPTTSTTSGSSTTTTTSVTVTTLGKPTTTTTISGGGSTSTTTTTVAAPHGGTLAGTGANSMLAVLLGAVMIGFGLALRRRPIEF